MKLTDNIAAASAVNGLGQAADGVTVTNDDSPTTPPSATSGSVQLVGRDLDGVIHETGLDDRPIAHADAMSDDKSTQIIQHDSSDTSCVALSAAQFSPPPNAFQNLPMMSRGKTGFTSFKPSSSSAAADSENKLSDESAVVLAVPTTTTSSSSQPNKKSIGILQIPHHLYPSSIQPSSSDEDSRINVLHFSLLKRGAQFGGGGGDDSGGIGATNNNTAEDATQEHTAILPNYKRRPSRESQVSLSDLSLESSDPSLNYQSVGDFFPNTTTSAVGDHPTNNDLPTENELSLTLSGNLKHQRKDEEQFNNNNNNNNNDNPDQFSLHHQTVQNMSRSEVVVVDSDESVSNSSESGSGYENESNTSSTVSMSTLVDARGGTHGGGGGPISNDTNAGIIGNRTNSHRANNIVRCERADDEYSTGSENSILIGKHPRRREVENKDQPDNSSSPKEAIYKPATPMIGLKNKIPGALISKMGFLGSVGVGLDDSYSSYNGDDDYVAPSAPFPSERLANHLLQNRVTAETPPTPTTHHIALFESFDRNWEQTVQGGSASNNAHEVLELGRKCFAAFAVVFGSWKDNLSGLPLYGTTPFRWWVEDVYSMHMEGADRDQDEEPQGIPIVVIRFLWKTCFLDPNSIDNTEAIIDSIQHTLVKELCILTEMETPSAPCLRLSLDVYAEYGRYILCRIAMQDQVASWHSKFAFSLRRLLLDSRLADAESMIKKRYAARSLPIHTAIGLLNVDAIGHSQLDFNDETRADLRRQVFDNLLSDKDFIHARAILLGRGDSHSAHAIQHASARRVATQISGSNVWNLLASTTQHMNDIDWCASLLNNRLPSQPIENIKDGISPLSCCLDAITGWQAELLASYHVLLTSGKLTIYDDSAKDPSDTNDEQCEVPNDDPRIQDVIKLAESLLAKNHAWIMEINSAKLLQNDTSKKFQSTRPPRKGRRKKEAIATTPLARILSIDVNELRTSISIGRSLLGLTEFSQTILDKYNCDKDRKETSSVASQVHMIQSSCLQFAIEAISCSATTLTYIVSNALDKLDEDDLDETVTTTLGPAAVLQRFSTTREDSKLLLYVAGILSADAWYSLGRLVSKLLLESAGSDVVFSIFDRALLVLNFPKSISLNNHTVEVLCRSLLSPLARVRCFLQSNITHSMGVKLYEQGDIDRADEYLTDASRFRRQMLDQLRRQDKEKVDDIDEYLSEMFNAVVCGMKNRSLVSSASITEQTFVASWKNSISHTFALLPRTIFTMDELESSLSLTLEYSALAQHAKQKYQSALALFQESLIFRNIHVGKHSLDVASLHFNMGVVYDDLEQYEQAISRYHESLRIRLNQRSKATSVEVMSELDDSLIMTLKCMGNVYRTMHDEDNAICCYVNAVEMTTKKLRSFQDSGDEFQTMGLHLGLAMPVPTIVFDEMKSREGVAHFQMMNKRDLCHVFELKIEKQPLQHTASKLKKRLTRMHSAIIKLVRDRNQNTSRCRMPAISSLLASLSSTFMAGGDAIEATLMRSSFFLGKVKLLQTKYEEAAEYLETALRSKWRLDPASSSDSDSDFSRKSKSRKQQRRHLDEDNPDEGQIYYALGICNAALDDHERAVRCFLTALRYLRRSLRKVDSLEVARIMFDCATSYYYLCNFEQSVSYYGECLRILTNHDTISSNDDNTAYPTKKNGSKNNAFRRGVVLYCIAAAKAAIAVDSEASISLAEARSQLSECEDKELLAYTTFLLGQVTRYDVSRVPVRMRSVIRMFSTGLGSDKSISWSEMCKITLNLFDLVQDECWFDPAEDISVSGEVKYLPLSGHICFEKGRVYELLGSSDQALKAFADAAQLYRVACGDENMYLGHALHTMGIISSQWREHHALGYFNEALSLRKKLLGGDDISVAETLYCSALVLARLNRYEASLERYKEALRIQMNHNQDSHEVARTLAGMGRCHYNHRAPALAIPCFEGSAKIRKYRVSGLSDSTTAVEVYGEEVALAECFFDLGNAHMQLKDQAQAMRFYIQARDIRWRHVGSGTVDSIVGRYHSGMPIDEDELLGLAHCLHNIGVMFDSKKDYQRSIPHYDEALTIKNAIAGFPADDSRPHGDQLNSDVIRATIIQALNENDSLRINKASLSASVTHQRIAMVYVEQQQYGDALFHFLKALRIQRRVLGKEHVWVGSLLSSMGNALRYLSTDSETAIICYDESLRISKLSVGQNHEAVASTMFNIGNLYDSEHSFTKAMYYYQSALSVHKQRYSQELRQRLCSGLSTSMALHDGSERSDVLRTGEIVRDAPPKEHIREQYALVKEALRMAKQQDKIHRGERINCVGDSEDVRLNLEALIFRFVEMLSMHVFQPANTTVRNTIDGTRRAIESAAAHSIISAADALDYQFLLLLQE